MPDPHYLLDGLQKAYRSSHLTDLKIVSGSEEFAVHKLVVCSQSKALQAMCLSGFQESATSTINLTNDGLILVKRMISSLYGEDYKDVEDSEKADSVPAARSNFALHAAMYAMGDKYDLPGLKTLARGKFDAEGHGNRGAETNQQVYRDFLLSIPLIYSSTPETDRGLRGFAVDWVCKLAVTYAMPGVKETLKKILSEVPDYSWELTHKLMRRKG